MSESPFECLRGQCESQGFDLCDPFHTGWYNTLIEDEGHVKSGVLKKLSVPPPSIFFGDDSTKTSGCNAVLIGNSKKIWPYFLEFLREEYEKEKTRLNDSEKAMEIVLNEPFDKFCTLKLQEIFEEVCTKSSGRHGSAFEYEIFWSHGKCSRMKLAERTNGTLHLRTLDSNENLMVSMQRAALVTGHYWHDVDGTKLCIHPKFGTWHSFRAVVIIHNRHEFSFDHDLIPKTAPSLLARPIPESEIERAQEVMKIALGQTTNGGTFSTKYGESLCQFLHSAIVEGSDWSKISPSIRSWIHLRDCISLGRAEYRFDDPQLLYHYTRDSTILRNELIKLNNESF